MHRVAAMSRPSPGGFSRRTLVSSPFNTERRVVPLTRTWVKDNADASVQEIGGFEWVFEQGKKIEMRTCAELEETERAEAVPGLVKEGRSRNEDDTARHYWHRRLKACADTGDYLEAERVVAEMRQEGHLPGPRAYHALIFTYVKGSNSSGALDAIRKEVNDGVQPMPQSYTAVVHGYLREGNIDHAEAVYASNRRAGVASDASWAAITTAFFRTGNSERALALLQQGVEEGLIPDRALYESLIKHHCRQDQLDEALGRLVEMQGNGIRPGKDHYSPLVTAHALAGEIDEAEGLLYSLLKAPGPVTAATIGAFNALLQTYLSIDLPENQLAERVGVLRQVMAKGGIALDRKGNSLLLETAMHLDDLALAMLAFRSLEQSKAGLQYVTDDVLGEFLLSLSTSNLPCAVHDVVAVMSREGRHFSPHLLSYTTSSGCTFLTAWLQSRLDELDVQASIDGGLEERRAVDWVIIDGVRLDPSSLCAINDDGETMLPNKMGVKELRAELAARQCPLRGNKKELTRQLQRARGAAEVDQSLIGDSGKRDGKVKKVQVVTVDQVWRGGKLVDRKEYLDEEIIDEEDEEEGDDEISALKDSEEELDDEFDDDFEFLDYGERVDATLNSQGSTFSNMQAGAREAIEILRGARNIAAVPSTADLSVLCAAIMANADKAALAEEALGVLGEDLLGSMSDAAAAEARQHMQALSAACSP